MADLNAALGYPAETRQRYIADGFWQEDRPQDWLARWVAADPDKPVSLGGGPAMTCADLQDKARRLATALLELGLGKGDVVILQLPNIPQLLVAFHGVQMMGGVPAMVHMPYRAAELAPMLNHIGARAVVCFNGQDGYDAAATFLELKDAVPSLDAVIVAAGDAPGDAILLDRLLETEAAPIADPPTAADPALILFTSGTSSSPKAVVHAYYTLCASARVSAEDMGIRDGDIVLCAPAFTHAFGLVCSLIYLYAGATAALMPAYTPPVLADCIRDTGATVICVGPAHIAANMKAGLWTEDVTKNIRAVFTGGAVCPPDLVDAFDAILPHGKLFQVWGMTEVLMPVCNRPDASDDERRHSLGQAPRGHHIRFADEAGNILGENEEGELQWRGPFMLHAYVDNPDATADAFTDDGFFRTGDLARMKDGRVFITGRAKDLINRGGIKINPVDIEAILEDHPAVVQAALIPAPDEVLGERACLVVVLAPDATLALSDAQAWLAQHEVLKIRWPEQLEVVDAMPMTPTRKIIKGKLAQQVLGTG